MYVFVCFLMLFPNFRILGAHAHFRVRRAPLQHDQKCEKSKFCFIMMLSMARSARESARAALKCTPMIFPDHLDAFWLFDHYHSSKIREFSFWWILLKIAKFCQKFFLAFFCKNQKMFQIQKKLEKWIFVLR